MAFDAHHPPSGSQVADCVHCGFCLPACPTYALWGKEADSPRGRIYLMRLGLEDRTPIDDNFTHHIDTCLGCMACVSACPSGVKYDELIEATRAQVERHTQRSVGDRLFRRMIFSLFPYPGRLRIAALALWTYQRLGLRRLVRTSGLLRLLPARIRALESVAPPVALSAAFAQLPERIPAHGTPRRTVALLLGCVQRTFFPEVNAATARVLAAEGCDVVVPRQQGCCGALALHTGGENGPSAGQAKRLVDLFDDLEVDTIVVNAAGCGSTLKEYGRLLRDEPAYAAKAETLSANAKIFRRCSPTFRLARCDILSRSPSLITMPVTFSTLRVWSLSRARSSERFRSYVFAKSPAPVCAVARPVSTTSSNPRRRKHWGNGRLRISARPRLRLWCRATRAACCNCRAASNEYSRGCRCR